MGKALSINEIQERINKREPNKYRVDETFRSDRCRNVRAFCYVHKKYFEQSISNFLYENSACDRCIIDRKREKEKPAKIKHFQKKIDSNPKYKGRFILRDLKHHEQEKRTYALVECLVHGMLENNWFRTKDLHRRTPCKECQGTKPTRKGNKEILREIAKKINNFDNYSVHKIERKNGRIFIFFGCNIHPEMALTHKKFDVIMSKSNPIPCNKCRSIFLKLQKLKHTAEIFCQEGSKLHPEYLYDLESIRKALLINIKKIPVICKKHGVFYTNYNRHIYSGQGFCKLCKENSYYEKVIRELLESKYKLNFKYNSGVFPDLRNINPLLIDFYINDLKLIIEYDGLHHFKIKPNYNDLKKFITGVKNDHKKNIYAKINKINILRIPYWDRKNIEKILDFVFSEIKEGKAIYRIHYMPYIVLKRKKLIKLKKNRPSNRLCKQNNND